MISSCAAVIADAVNGASVSGAPPWAGCSTAGTASASAAGGAATVAASAGSATARAGGGVNSTDCDCGGAGCPQANVTARLSANPVAMTTCQACRRPVKTRVPLLTLPHTPDSGRRTSPHTWFGTEFPETMI